MQKVELPEPTTDWFDVLMCVLINTSASSHWLKSVAWPVGSSFTEYQISINGFGGFFGGRYRLEGNVGTASRRVHPQDIYTFEILPLSPQFEYNIMSGTWKENKRSTLWLNFDDTSKFCGEKYIGFSRWNIDSPLRVICK